MDSLLADRALVKDWLNFGTMFVVSRLLAGGALDDNAWIMSCLYTLLGFTTYHLVVKKMIPNNMSGAMERVMNTWLKVGTMLTVSRLLSGEPLNEKWMMSSLYTLLGFNAYDIITIDMVPNNLTGNEAINAAINTIVCVGTMSVVSRVLSGEPLNQKWLSGTVYTLVGFATYDVVVGPMILH